MACRAWSGLVTGRRRRSSAHSGLPPRRRRARPCRDVPSSRHGPRSLGRFLAYRARMAEPRTTTQDTLIGASMRIAYLYFMADRPELIQRIAPAHAAYWLGAGPPRVPGWPVRRPVGRA